MKIVKKAMAICLCFALALGGVTYYISVEAKDNRVKLNKTKVVLRENGKVQLKLKNAKAGKVRWSSTNSKVAKVS